MKDWRRSPEPPGMMGLKDASYQVTGNWGQPEELNQLDFDPASPLPHTTPTIFVTDSHHPSRTPHTHQRSASLSLYSMALRVILRNISSVQDLGVLPYRHAKPILEECRIEQLITLEEASPHLLEHTEEIWRRNCLRDFLDLRRKYTSSDTPAKDPRSWRKLYFKTQGEIEKAKEGAAKRIKDKYEQFRAEKEAKKLVVRDRPMMAKAARAGGRKFGGGVGGGVSKGQSLLNKARSGSVAQAKLTAPRGGTGGFRTQGRSKAVGVEIASEAAGMERRVRPMVAPKKVPGGASEGLAKMREFSMTGEAEREGSASMSSLARVKGGTQRSDSEAATARPSADPILESSPLPRLKPHEVAAAPPITSSSSRPKPSQSAEPARKRTPSSPPPDVARAERRKIDFFSSRPSPSSSSSTPLTSSSPRGAPPPPLSPGVEVRGMKRAAPSISRSKSVSSPPASSSSAGASSGGGGGGGVRVVQAKRARATQVVEETISLTSTPTPTTAETTSSGKSREVLCRPSPVRQPSSSSIARPPPLPAGDSKLARASPAALSSIFMPSSSPPAGKRGGARSSGGGRLGR